MQKILRNIVCVNMPIKGLKFYLNFIICDQSVSFVE